MITAYYRFEVLPDDVKVKHGIKAKARLDCTAYTNPTSYKGLMNFVNAKGYKFLYKNATKQYIKASSKRLAEWALGNGTLNLSSIYFEDIDFPQYGYGYPNANRLLSKGEPNPLFPFRNDCYLFITNKDLSHIELLVITDGRNLATGYYQLLIDGGLDQELKHLREKAQPFFNYESAL